MNLTISYPTRDQCCYSLALFARYISLLSGGDCKTENKAVCCCFICHTPMWDIRSAAEFAIGGLSCPYCTNGYRRWMDPHKQSRGTARLDTVPYLRTMKQSLEYRLPKSGMSQGMNFQYPPKTKFKSPQGLCALWTKVVVEGEYDIWWSSANRGTPIKFICQGERTTREMTLAIRWCRILSAFFEKVDI